MATISMPAPASAAEDDIDSRVKSGRIEEVNEAPQKEENGDQDETINLEDFGEDVDETARLKHLAATVRDQDDLERDIGRQAC